MELDPSIRFYNDDGSVSAKPAANIYLSRSNPVEHFNNVVTSMKEYKWRDEDVLLATYPKNGTHLFWEIITMLLRDSAEYVKVPKLACMIEAVPVSTCDEVISSPRVLNTHLRTDLLPSQYRSAKTVCAIRNAKDTIVSGYYHMTALTAQRYANNQKILDTTKITFEEFLLEGLSNKDIQYGSYLDYVDYMWSRKDDPNLLIVFFEDAIKNSAETVQKLNEFLETKRSPELVQQIADATSFTTMKGTKHGLGKAVGYDAGIYRKGKIGDWKNVFTVADNERVDAVLNEWTMSKEIPFQYE